MILRFRPKSMSCCRACRTTTSPASSTPPEKGLEAIGRIAVPDPSVAFYVRAALVEAEFYAGLGIHLERLDGLDPDRGLRFPPVRAASRGDDLVGRLLDVFRTHR